MTPVSAVVGFGTFLGREATSDPSQTKSILTRALEAGFRHIDTAQFYQNESAVGECLSEAFQNEICTRDDLFITAKIWCINMHRDVVEKSLRSTLRKLQLDYVDVCLLHTPVATRRVPDESANGIDGFKPFPRDENGNLLFDDDVDYLDSFQALAGCLEKGLTREIGVSNFNQAQIERLISAGCRKPQWLQVEVSPYHQNRQLIDFCLKHSINVQGYSVFRGSAKASKEDPTAYENAFADPVVVGIAKSHRRTPSQVVLRYLCQLGVFPFCRSTNEERIVENSPDNVAAFSLDVEEMEKMKMLDQNRRYVNLVMLRNSRFYPF